MPTCASILALLLLGSCQSATIALDGSRGQITLDRLFGGEFSETGLGPVGDWVPGINGLVSAEANSDIVQTDLPSGKRTVLVAGHLLIPSGETKPLKVERFWFSSDLSKLLVFTNSVKVWRQNTKGDFWVLDRNAKRLRQLGPKGNPSSLMFAKLSPDGSKAGFVFKNNLYCQEVDTGKITPLTTDGSPNLIDGSFDWVYEEEFDLRDGWRWSPDGRTIAYWQVDSSMEPIYTLIDDTDASSPTLNQFPYPKPGEANATVRIGIVPANGGRTRWIEEGADSKSGYIARMDWADNSQEVFYEKLNRRQNRNEFRIADAATGKAKTAWTDFDDAWVDVLDTDPNGIKWLADESRFLAFSERSGWRHLYAIARDGTTQSDLTPGNFDVRDYLGVDESGGYVYYTASPDDATQSYLYVTELKDPKPRRLTPSSDTGTNDYRLSPDAKLAIHSHSSYGTPGERELVSLPEHRTIRVYGDNSELKAKLKAYDLGLRKLVKLQTADGEPMDASVIFPPDFDPKKRYPLFFEVYGEPAGTTVHDQWDSFGYLFQQMVAQHGYIVASADNRGTPSLKGRKWRKSIYKKIGIIASEDQAAAAKQLASLPFVDPARIGIWGWSGGGSMTLNMLFRYPDLYALGMSVAPVPDTTLYDSIYQERYMGTPQENPEAYRESSPITFAKRLKGNLLIVHGSGDDNVHYQGTERLVNELVADGKPFQMMVYPNRTHAISEGTGTTRHLYELLIRFLTTNMPGGAR
ncbi:MAG: S9 family peptidase [Fimbriimonas sp.]|nr:S9 family peptidase [Fimbriimonas sp.]